MHYREPVVSRSSLHAYLLKGRDPSIKVIFKEYDKVAGKHTVLHSCPFLCYFTATRRDLTQGTWY